MTKPNQDILSQDILLYDFNRLAAVCTELDFQYQQPSEDEFKIILRDDIYLALVNLIDDIDSIKPKKEEENAVVVKGREDATVAYQDVEGEIKYAYSIPYTMAYMCETGDHLHGVNLQMGASEDPETFECTRVHYLDIPLLIRTGEILIYERYYQNLLELRWLVYHTDLTREFNSLNPGEEVRIFRI